MKFPGFREFSVRIPTLDEVINYLRVEHSVNLKELITGLRNLTFVDNFQAFEVTVDIPAGAEVGIENKIKGVIPSKRLIVRSNSHEIADGDTAWTKEFVYMKNLGASAATVTLVFMK